MRKIKTKAELKSVGGLSIKSEEDMAPFGTCGLCYKVLLISTKIFLSLAHKIFFQEFNTQQDFKDHDLDHPSVERIPLMPKLPFPKKKKEYRCPTCSKKFKNETSLNYHSMFHTADEKPSEPTSSATTTTTTSVSSVTPSTTSLPSSASKSASYESSDSDSDNDSRHLSLKHISNSVKRITESQKKLKEKNQPETETELKVTKKPPIKPKLECEVCRKKFKDPLAFEYHKITFHVQAEASSHREDETASKSNKLNKSAGNSSDKPKKRKSESNLDDTHIKKQKIVSEKSDKIKSKLLTGIFRKTQRQVSDISEDDSKSVIESIKSTLSLMHRGKKKKPSPSRGGKPNYKDDSDSDQSEEDNVKVNRKANLPQRKRGILSRKIKTSSESGGSESSDEDEYVSKKSDAKKNQASKTIEKEFQSHSIDAILRSKDEPKEKKKLVKQVKTKNMKRPKTVTSDSEPEIVKKEEKPEIKIEIVDSEDESTKIRESLLSTKNSKVKCEGCNKTFKNTLVLNYHQLHCELAQTSKSAFNLVEKNILNSKKSSESPADKILKKLTETAKTCEKLQEPKPPPSIEVNRSKAKVLTDKKKNNKAVKVEAKADPKVKRCDVTVKKINKDTMNKFKDDLKSVPNAKKLVKSCAIVSKILTKQTAQRKSKSTPSLGKVSKPQCPHCGKKYADIMALNYHKITFHVEEKETELFSSSAYHEQMSFDKNVLKLNNTEGRRLSLEAKSEASSSSPKVLREELGKITAKQTHNIIDKRKSVENTNPSSIEKRKSIENNKSVGESKKIQEQSEESSSGYCVPYCDKPERDDMLG